MTTQNVHEELQFDYFSQNYYQFQEDFYQFSNLPQPLMIMDRAGHLLVSSQLFLALSQGNNIEDLGQLYCILGQSEPKKCHSF